MAECCPAPAFARRRNRFLRPCFKKFSRGGHSSSLRTDLKTQESFLQDLETWLAIASTVHSPQSKVGDAPSSIFHPPSLAAPKESEGESPLFYPPWEILPHEGKLPHADIISDRLQTLVALSDNSTLRNSALRTWSSPASPRCCRKLFRRAKFKNARARLSAATKSSRSI